MPRATAKKKSVRRNPIAKAVPKDPEIITKVVEVAPEPAPAPKREERRRRTPLGGLRYKGSFSKELITPGCVPQWWPEDNLIEAQKGGFRFVHDQPDCEIGEGQGLMERKGLDSRVSHISGKNADGSPQRSYLMEIETEYWNEDKAADHQASQEVIDNMKRGVDMGGAPGEDGRYTPKEGIKIENSTR
jgi:hypothetical protein